jgi:Spy/CpxP family protein refolding chaperone
MKWNWLIITIGTCLTGGVIAASAATPQSNSGTFADNFVAHRLEHKLNLTDAQRTQLRAILQAERPTIQALAVRLRNENQQLTARDTFDEAFVRSVAAQHDATMTDVLVEREKVRTEVLQVLTPEQRAKLKQLRAAMSERLATRLTNAPDQLGDVL